MNLNLPESSRTMQNVQHIVGGIYQIMLITVGVLFGKGDWTSGVILGFFTFLLSRLSSEITYQVQIRVIRENTKHDNNNML